MPRNKTCTPKTPRKRATLSSKKTLPAPAPAPAPAPTPAGTKTDPSRLEYEIWIRKLRALRRSRGWLQRDVIERMPSAISRCHYVSIEHGRSNVSYKHLYNLSKAFGISLSEMVTLSSVTDEQLRKSTAQDLQVKSKSASASQKKEPAPFKKVSLDPRVKTTRPWRPLEDATSSASHIPSPGPDKAKRRAIRNKKRASHTEPIIEAETPLPTRGRPKGSHVLICTCGARIVGMPGTQKECYFCKKVHTLPL